MRMCVLSGALCSFAMFLGPTRAQGYPAQPIRVIIPAAPWDSCDTLSRLVGQKAAERPGQQLTIDNRLETIRKEFATWGKLAQDIGFEPR